MNVLLARAAAARFKLDGLRFKLDGLRWEHAQLRKRDACPWPAVEDKPIEGAEKPRSFDWLHS